MAMSLNPQLGAAGADLDLAPRYLPAGCSPLLPGGPDLEAGQRSRVAAKQRIVGDRAAAQARRCRGVGGEGDRADVEQLDVVNFADIRRAGGPLRPFLRADQERET